MKRTYEMQLLLDVMAETRVDAKIMRNIAIEQTRSTTAHYYDGKAAGKKEVVTMIQRALRELTGVNKAF